MLETPRLQNELPRYKIFIFVHIAVSVFIGVVFIALVIINILSIYDMLSEWAAYCVLGVIVFVLFPTSLLFLKRPHLRPI